VRAAPERWIDLNADCGELSSDLGLVGLVTSANIACGSHAGDRASMQAAVAAALLHGTVVGAHPSYPDRDGFGRVELGLATSEIVGPVLEQIVQLAGVAEVEGGSVRYVKLHGALYHRAAVDPECADALVAGISSSGLGAMAILAQPGSMMLVAAAAAGLQTATEGFCDRGYRADGRLVERGEPGALLEDPGRVADQAVALATTGGTLAVDGRFIAVAADSLCLHGDAPDAVETARRVRSALESAAVALRSFAAPSPRGAE
jgi:UPF0271 protein